MENNQNNNSQMPQQPMQGQPMNGGQMNSGMPQQNMGQPMQGQMPSNGYGYPMQQMPMQKPPKQPMDPVKKKKLILGLSIGSGVLVLGIAAAIILPMILRVDYSETYKTAKELKPIISEIYTDDNCYYVQSYANSDYVSASDYDKYITGCKEAYTKATSLVDQLGETAGIKKDSELENLYNKFRAAYSKEDKYSAEEIDQKLALYKTWHDWEIAVDKVDSWDETDADLTAAANVLINSDNDTLKSYGEGWLEKRKAAANAYRTWYNAKYSDKNYQSYLTAKNDAQTAHNNFVKENKPNIEELAGQIETSFSETDSEFDKLYDSIVKRYEEHYNFGSGDCFEFAGEVSCD